MVLAECSQQIGKGLLGNVFGDYRFAQCDEDGMRGPAVVTRIEFALPPIKKFEGALFLGNFVAEIVGPAAISIEIVEMLVQILGEQPGDDIEIFVVVSGEPARVLLRRCRGAARSRERDAAISSSPGRNIQERFLAPQKRAGGQKARVRTE